MRKKRTKVNVKPGRSIGVEDFEREDVFADVDRSVKPRNSNKKQKPVESLSEDEDGFSVQDSDEGLILSSSDSPNQVENADTRRHLHQSR